MRKYRIRPVPLVDAVNVGANRWTPTLVVVEEEPAMPVATLDGSALDFTPAVFVTFQTRKTKRQTEVYISLSPQTAYALGWALFTLAREISLTPTGGGETTQEVAS